MTAEIISGTQIAAEIREELKEKVKGLRDKGIIPGLVMVRVGEDPAALRVLFVLPKGGYATTLLSWAVALH